MRNILIVEDNIPMAQGLAYLFKGAGYRPETFQLGLPAIERVLSGDPKPAAAIIDLHLPDISGLVLSQKLRDALGPETPIVVLSGDGSMEVLNSLTHVGATHFFRKPVNASTLLEWVQERLQ